MDSSFRWTPVSHPSVGGDRGWERPGEHLNEGASARHDMCMDQADLTNDGYNPCNRDLHDRMGPICTNVYWSYGPRRYNFRDFRDAYWVAVTETNLDEHG
ncbi:putative secreted protein [Rhodococcus sp. AW25M09]|nr:putative secreted protein [Rhodococcus sp. AW25M09]